MPKGAHPHAKADLLHHCVARGYYKTPDETVPEQFEPLEQEQRYANDLVRGADALVFGRGMYETMTY